MAKAEAEEILAFVFYRIHLIEETLRDINLKRYPSRNPQVYAHLIKDICSYIKSHLFTLNREDDSFDSDQMEDRLKIISLYVTSLATDLEDINDAGGDITSWDLIHPFEDFSKKIYDDILIILKPFWEFNFAIRNRLVDHKGQLQAILPEDCFEELFKKFPTAITDIYIISFPAFEKTNILLQGNLGHELGHPLALQYFDIEDESYLTDIKHDIKEVVAATIKKFEDQTGSKTDELFREKIESDTLSEILNIRGNALNELISDMVSIRLFGIAAILSAYEYAETIRKFDEVSENSYYPPWRMRLRVMLDELSPTNIMTKTALFLNEEAKTGKDVTLYKDIYDSLEAKINELKAFTSITKDMDSIEGKDNYRIAYKSILKSLPVVKEFLNQNPPKDINSIENDIETIFKLCQRIDHKLPPNAVEKNPFVPDPADIRKIINAGWLYKITKLTYCPKTEEENTDYLSKIDLLNRLIFKALELADIYTRYKNRGV